MDPQVVAALITVVGALVIAWWQIRASRKSAQAAVLLPHTDQTAPLSAHQQRFLDQPHNLLFIACLPERKRAQTAEARKLWGGSTADMREGNSKMIGFLKSAWIKLANFYPDGHFGNTSHAHYLDELVKARVDDLYVKHEPDGPGTGGTIAPVLVGGELIQELDAMVCDIAATILQRSQKAEHSDWTFKWKEAGKGAS